MFNCASADWGSKENEWMKNSDMWADCFAEAMDATVIQIRDFLGWIAIQTHSYSPEIR